MKRNKKMNYKKAQCPQKEEQLIIEPVPKGQWQKSTHGRTSLHNVFSKFIGHFYYNMIDRKMLCFYRLAVNAAVILILICV